SFNELANGSSNTGCNYIIFSSFLLKHQPHGLNVILCMAPVAFCREVSQVKAILQSKCYFTYRTCNFTCHKSFSTNRTLMIKEDTIAGIHVISLSVVISNPVSIKFSNGIRRTWVKRCFLTLRNLLY